MCFWVKVPAMTAQELYDYRKAKKLTQQQFADWLGVKKRRLQSWEAGLHPVPDWAEDKLLKIPALTPGLTLGEFQRLAEKAASQNKTVEQVIADLIRNALLLAFFLGGAYVLLS